MGKTKRSAVCFAVEYNYRNNYHRRTNKKNGMSFQTYIPSFPLSSYVYMIWHWQDYSPAHTKERILPTGLMELTFNLSDRDFSIQLTGSESLTYSGAILVGCQSKYFLIDTSEPTTILSVLFKPGGALRFFGASTKELHNHILSLSDVWSLTADSLYDRLLACRCVAQRFHILEEVLLARLNAQYERHYAVDVALSVMTTYSQPYTIAELEQEVALSPTRFIQVFREDIGLTPKVYSRLQRFHRVLDVIASGQAIDWADLAVRCGYYDQSHLINEFQIFAGITPLAYAPQNRQHNKNLPYFESS